MELLISLASWLIPSLIVFFLTVKITGEIMFWSRYFREPGKQQAAEAKEALEARLREAFTAGRATADEQIARAFSDGVVFGQAMPKGAKLQSVRVMSYPLLPTQNSETPKTIA
jgi:hypothetical protein